MKNEKMTTDINEMTIGQVVAITEYMKTNNEAEKIRIQISKDSFRGKDLAKAINGWFVYVSGAIIAVSMAVSAVGGVVWLAFALKRFIGG